MFDSFEEIWKGFVVHKNKKYYKSVFVEWADTFSFNHPS